MPQFKKPKNTKNMELLINELESCLSNKMFIISLNIALTIPDICSALQSENGCTTGKKYANWIDKYLTPKYEGYVTGEDIYKLRCASLHQGKLNHDFPKFEKIIFQIPFKGFIMHKNIFDNALNLNVEVFIKDIIEGYKDWLNENESNENVIKNANESFMYHPNGLKPYVIGIPILA